MVVKIVNHELLSKRQIITIGSIPTAEMDIHCGPYGCGKSYAVNIGLGLACATSRPPDDDSCIALIGKTAMTVKMNICNVLASKFGKNFRYDSGRKDGFTKDAVLFGHRLRIVGLNDSNAEERLRGLNAYKIIGDEVSTWGKENFDRVIGRLRGKTPQGWKHGLVGTTNPDSPSHWLWKTIQESPDINYIKWTEHDNITSGAREYYEKLRNRYRNNSAYYKRYVLGEWASAEGLVYTEFNDRHHVLSVTDVEKLMPHFVSFKLGVDFGTTNPTAILLIGVTESQEYVVIREVYMREATLSRVCNEIRNIVIEFHNNLKKVFIDPSAKVLIQELKSQGMLNIYGADNSVMNGINYVKDLFSQDRLYISESCTNLIDELYTYAFSDKDGVNVIKENDHACDALRYALYN